MTISAALVRSMLGLRNEQKTGLLRVEWEGTKTFVYLREGVPVFAEEGSLGETLGRLLVRQRKLTQAQYVTVIQNMTEALVLNEQLRFGEVCVELGYLTEEDVKKALGDQMRWKIVRLFQRKDVSWELVESASHLDGVGHFPMRIEAMVLDAVRWIDDEEKDGLGLRAAREQQIRIEPEEIPWLVTRFELTKDEGALLAELDGKTVASVLASEAARGVDAPAILTALLVTRTVTTQAEPKLQRPMTPVFDIPISIAPPVFEKKETEATASGALARPAAADGGPTTSSKPTVKQEMAVSAEAVSADPRPASTAAAPAAAASAAAAAAPRKPPAITRTTRILNALREQKVKVDAERVPESEHEAKLLAERACQAGLEHLLAGRHAQAAPELARASRLLPASDEYKLYAKWAQVKSTQAGVGFHEVERAELKKLAIGALKVDPNLAFAHYVAGTVARDENDLGAARRLLARAVKLDPSLTDAQRQLRILVRRDEEAAKPKKKGFL